MNNIDKTDNNDNDDINIKEGFQEVINEVKRKIRRPPFIKADKTIFKKEKKYNYLF
jgi:hypothetical protein